MITDYSYIFELASEKREKNDQFFFAWHGFTIWNKTIALESKRSKPLKKLRGPIQKLFNAYSKIIKSPYCWSFFLQK